MKPVYSVHLRFVSSSPESREAGAWGIVTEWLRDITDVPDLNEQLSRPGEVTIQSPNGSQIRRLEIMSGDQSVRRIEHSIPPSPDSPAGWTTLVWVCRDGDAVWGVVRSGPNFEPGVITRVGYQASRPGVVGRWIESLQVAADGQRIATEPWNWGQSDAESMIALLEMPARRLPVVGISKAGVDGEMRTLLDPKWLARNLAGLAHVVVVDRALSWRLTEELGKQHGVYNGGIRVWWPQFSRSEDPYRHVLVLPDQITSGVERVERFLTGRIWGIAVDAIGAPVLETRLLRQASRALMERRIEQARNGSAQVSRSDHDELLDELEMQLTRVEELESRLDLLQDENEDLRDELVRAKSGQMDGFDIETEVATIEEAVVLAAKEAENVVFLPGAYRSAQESQYPNPAHVLADLRALNRVAKKWSDGNLGGDFRSAFEQEPVKFRPFVSDTAIRKYGVDYEIEVGGRRVHMGPHLRRGVGPPNTILRIYWYVDEDTKQIFVGHVGRKLRDDSNN